MPPTRTESGAPIDLAKLPKCVIVGPRRAVKGGAGKVYTGRVGLGAEVGVAHAPVGLGQAHPQARVGVAVRVPIRQGGRGQPVLVVPGEARRLPVDRLRRQVPVEVVALGLAGPAGQLVVGVVGEGLCQRPVLGLR